jgi:hypothetical protein
MKILLTLFFLQQIAFFIRLNIVKRHVEEKEYDII